jgi:hypothetical protein
VIKSFYAVNFDYEMKVANEVAVYAPARAKVVAVANKTVALAKSNLRNAPTTPKTLKLREKVLDKIMVKDAGLNTTRKRITPVGSKILVYLVVSNSGFSRRFEYGYGVGNSFPASHFMGIAARASRKKGVLYYSRDWGK